jgi:hypothetical protein
VTDSRVKNLKKKCARYALEAKREHLKTLKALGSISSEMVAVAMVSGLKRLSPTFIDKMEVHILKLLAGWSIHDIECLLVHRVLPEVKRRANLPKRGTR